MALLDTIERIDAAVGGSLERAVCSHHRRRLGKLGWSRALAGAGGWAARTSPPRRGNSLEVLIDGEQALPRIAEALAGARSHVHMAGWHITPQLRADARRAARRSCAICSPRSPSGSTSGCCCGAGRRCRSSGPRGGRAASRATSSSAGTRVRCALDTHERPMHCHHEKLVIVDDEVAFVGGIDLTDARRRPLRPAAAIRCAAALGWHDVATPAARPGRGRRGAPLRVRWHEVDRRALAASPAAERGRDDRACRSCARCPSRSTSSLPRGDFSHPRGYVARSARPSGSIYLENQFLWSPEIVEILREQAARPADRRLPPAASCCPAKPNNGADDTRGQLARARRRPTTARAASSPARSTPSATGVGRPRVRAREGRRSSTTAG